jgi:hypothetical protein
MKINDIIQETTSAGGIATVAVPLGGMQKRPNASVFTNTTPKKKKKKATENTKDEANNPDGYHHTSNEPFIDPEGPQDHIEDKIKGTIQRFINYLKNSKEEIAKLEADPEYQNSDEEGQYQMRSHEGVDDIDIKDLRDVLQFFQEALADHQENGTTHWWQSEFVSVDTAVSDDIASLLSEIDAWKGDLEEATNELNDLRKRAGLEVKERYKEGKSPHKKGTAKYKKHMAAMHAEATLQTGGYGKPRKPRHTATV